MRLIPDGAHIFEVISRYDDLLTLEERRDYEPGDTLSLIVPFLLHHHIPESAITRLAEGAALVEGAQELISELRTQGWEVFCISTSYEQYARCICHRLSIAAENIACTSFPLDRFHSKLSAEDLAIVETVERDITSLQPVQDDEVIEQRLDHFFWVQLARGEVGDAMMSVKPVGGQKKVAALERFASSCNQHLSAVVAVGDSITDFRMLKAINEAGGLAIAFNANEYALPYATMGLASTNLSDLEPVLEAWGKGGREAVEVIVRSREQEGGQGNRGHFHWLCDIKDISAPLKIHKWIRRLVREEAGKLG
jgi:energy-converting hydrogenase A subunit R